MKKIFGLFVCGILAASLFNFEARATTIRPDIQKEAKKFSSFLKKRPVIEMDLRANPNLINDPQYLRVHRDLEKFLRKNPQIAYDFSSNPNYFMNRSASRIKIKKQKHKRIRIPKIFKPRKHPWWRH